MHKEILTKEQRELLPMIKSFDKDFGLVGGTAIAFHIGHRRSIDFDLFTEKPFNNLRVKAKITRREKISEILVNKTLEYTILINQVKLTFFQYPFKIEYADKLDGVIKMPDLLTLAAMKAYALGMRAKWKDYVDLYFIIKEHYSIDKITQKAKQMFGGEFNEKIFRTQLSYFEDINYAEKIEYLPGFEVSDKEVKKALIEFSLKN